MNRMFAIVEREMRKFFRSPVLMIMSHDAADRAAADPGQCVWRKIVGAQRGGGG